MLQQARDHGWLAAVLRECSGDPHSLLSFLDWQRCSWLSLLGLPKESVALILGDRYAVLTQALATVLGEVYSVELRPQRVKFARIRLDQEGISNAHLIQSSPWCLPFCARSFDLIVVNDPYQTVSSDDSTEDCRELQARLLVRLHDLLKEGGVLVILGLNVGRSRDVESYPPQLEPSKRFELSGRNTHFILEYRKLLTASGFSAVEFLWPTPSLNEVYTLVPLQDFSVQLHHREGAWVSPRLSTRWWRQYAKLLLAKIRIVSLFVRQSIAFARKRSKSDTVPNTMLGEPLAKALQRFCFFKAPVATLRTYALGCKNLLRVFETGTIQPRLIIKSTTPAQESHEVLETECRNLALVQNCLKYAKNCSFSTPQLLGDFQLGSIHYWVESMAPGLPLSVIFPMQPRHRRIEFVRQELRRCVNVAVELAQVLYGKVSVPLAESSGPGHRDILADLATRIPEFQRLLPLLEARGWWSRADDQNYVRHGDFTIENILKHPTSGQLTIIDWGELVRGVPPLYDAFSLLLSAVPFVEFEGDVCRDGESLSQKQFLTAFFGRGRWTELFRTLLRIATRNMEVPEPEVFDRFTYFLALRIRYFHLRMHPRIRTEPAFLHPMALEHAKYLALALTHADQFLLGHQQS